MRQQEMDKFCGKLPFASEVCDEEQGHAPRISAPLEFASQHETLQSEEPIASSPVETSYIAARTVASSPAPAPVFSSTTQPTQVHTSMPVPSMYEQPKKQILATHYEAQARTEERLVQTYVSQSIDMTSPVATSTQTEAVNEKNASPSDEGEEQLGTITSDVKEHPSLLHFLFGFLPGASTPQTWRPAGTAVVLALILFMGWHVINGKDGLSVWQQKRAEDKRLQIEIDQLQQENARLHDHISSLNTDKDAIEREAREKLHYARSGEIIYAIPEQAAQSSPAR